MENLHLKSFFLCVVCCWAQLSSQNLTVQFIDLNTNDTLMPKTLVATNKKGFKVEYFKNANSFSFKDTIYSIYATFKGKNSINENYKNGICCINLQLFANSDNEFMNEVVIGINKENSKLQQSTVSSSVLKPYLIENKITTNFSKILEQMPGVMVTDNQINIRNGSGWSYGSGSRVMITLNGLPLLNGDANAALWTFMPQEITASAEIVKSAGSVVFGSSAINGVLNVKSIANGNKEKFQFNFNSGIFSSPPNNKHIYRKQVGIQFGNSGYYTSKAGVNNWLFHWNQFYDAGYRQFETDNRFRFGMHYLRKNQKIKGLEYGLNFTAQNGKAGSFLLWESNNLPYTSYDSGFNYSYGTRIAIDPTIVWIKNKIKHSFINRFLYSNNRIVDNSPLTNNSNGSNLVYNEYKLTNYLGKYFILSNGLVHQFSSTSSPLYRIAQNTRNLAVFSQCDVNYKRLTLNAGLRYEYFNMTGNKSAKPVFRTGVNFKLAPATFLRASIGQGFRFPSIAEAYTQTTVGTISIYANPNLKPESSLAREIGIKQGFLGKKWSGYVDLAYFNTNMYNMLEFTFAQWTEFPVLPDFGYGFKSLNVGKSNIQGIEFETASKYKTKTFELIILAGYTYTLARSLEPNFIFGQSANAIKENLTFLNTKSDPNNFLKYRYPHILKADLQVNIKKLMLGLSTRYQSKMLNIDKAFQEFPIDIFIPGVKQTRAIMGNVTIFDFRIGYTIHTRWTATLQIQNIANKAYINRPADMQAPRLTQLQFKYTW